MRLPALIHLLDEDPILGELESTPNPAASFITVLNPRRRDGRPAPFLESNVEKVLFAWHRISYIQMLPEIDLEQVIGFVRE
jgi:hypothetical protein